MINRVWKHLNTREWLDVQKMPWKLILSSDGSFRRWTGPVVLLVVAFACYGIYANHLGFYWDDWAFAWVRFFKGFEGMKAMAAVNRPLRAYFEAALTPILGVNPLAWQVFSILLRWITSVALWWFLHLVWGKKPRPIFMVALLYLVYPGFSQQFLALTYYYFWLLQAIFFISLGLMVLAVLNPKYFWPGIISALLLSALQLFANDYLVGLDLLRPIFLFVVLAPVLPNIKQRLNRTALYSMPFLLILGVYLCWRIFGLKFLTYQPVLLEEVRSAPIRGLLGLASTIWHSFGVLTVQAWENTLQVAINTWGTTRFATIYPLLVSICLVGMILYQNRLQAHRPSSSAPDPTNDRRRYVWQFIGIGLIAILFAGIPFYVTGLTVQPHFESDRFSMSYILGVSLLLTGLLELLPNFWQSITLTAVLAGLAVGLQFYNSALFRSESDLQKTFAWQLVWRAPGLKQNTMLLSDNLAFPFTDDEGLTYLLNWTYAPENRSDQLTVALDTLSNRLEVSIPSLEHGQPIYQNIFLSVGFRGNTDQVVVVYFNPPSCLRVLNPKYDRNLVFLSVYKSKFGRPVVLNARALPPLVASALPLSNVDQIIPHPDHSARPPAFLFDPEPSTNWCYFFEKADLARQFDNWQEVVSLGDQALGGKYYPADLSELLVFIEGYARFGRWQDANKLVQTISDSAPVLNPSICAILERTKPAGELSMPDDLLMESMKQELQCAPPL